MSDIDVIRKFEMLEELIAENLLCLDVDMSALTITKSGHDLLRCFKTVDEAIAYVEGVKDGVMYG